MKTESNIEFIYNLGNIFIQGSLIYQISTWMLYNNINLINMYENHAHLKTGFHFERLLGYLKHQ